MSEKEFENRMLREDLPFGVGCALLGAGILAAIQAACGVFG